MPRGNPQNLTSLGDRTIEERQKIARKAGQASGKARRNKAMLRDCLEILMEKKMKGGQFPCKIKFFRFYKL